MRRLQTWTVALLVVLLCLALFWALMMIASAQPTPPGLPSSLLDRIHMATFSRAIPGFSAPPFSVRGFNPNIDSLAFKSIWNGPTDFVPIQLTDLLMTIFSDNAADTLAGTGARTVRIQCLDDVFVTFAENVEMNGPAGQAMVRNCLRVQRIAVTSSGTDFLANTGTLTLENGGTVYGIVGLGEDGLGQGLSQAAFFTVPDEHVGFLTTIEVSGSAGIDLQLTFGIEAGPYTRLPEKVQQGAQIVPVNACFSEHTTLELQVQKDTGGTAETATGSMHVILADSVGGQCPEEGIDRPL